MPPIGISTESRIDVIREFRTSQASLDGLLLTAETAEHADQKTFLSGHPSAPLGHSSLVTIRPVV